MLFWEGGVYVKAGNRMWYEVDLKKGKTRVVKLGMVAATGKRIGVWTREIRTKSGICVGVPGFRW